MKLEVLDEIERKVSKLDSIQEKLERFSSRLTEIEKTVAHNPIAVALFLSLFSVNNDLHV